MYIDREARPKDVIPAVRMAATAIGGVLTLLTLLAAGWRRAGSRHSEVLFVGGLSVNMLLLAPTGHPHYLVLLVPLMMGLLAYQWGRSPSAQVDGKLRWLLAANFTFSAVPLVLESNLLFHLGFPMYTAILFWLGGMLVLRRLRHIEPAVVVREQKAAA
jgi:hypothetical protein